jgi:hypothetical protein
VVLKSRIRRDGALRGKASNLLLRLLESLEDELDRA